MACGMNLKELCTFIDDKCADLFVTLILQARRHAGFITFDEVTESCFDIEAPGLPRRGQDWTSRLNYLDSVEVEEALSTPPIILQDDGVPKEVPLCPLSVAEKQLFFTFCNLSCLHVDMGHK